jgi:hypothetical protein
MSELDRPLTDEEIIEEANYACWEGNENLMVELLTALVMRRVEIKEVYARQ